MNKTHFMSALIAASACLWSIPAGLAQTFKAGDIVTVTEYGKSVEVRVIKQDASGVLCLQKDWKDGTFKTGGSSCYYDASAMTLFVPPAALPTATGGGYGGAGGAPVQRNYSQGQGAAAGAALGGTGPLSKQQILDYLSANVGTDGPHPKKDSINAAVLAAIKKRGVNWKVSYKDDFSGAGGDTSIYYGMQDNYGTPPELPWLFGPWDLTFTNVSTFYASRDSVAKMGFISIEPSHTYIWKVHANDPPKAWIDGKWRDATPEEMKYRGGAGIVLLNGEQNYDWIVHKDGTADPGKDWINVADINTRQVKRGGIRKLH